MMLKSCRCALPLILAAVLSGCFHVRIPSSPEIAFPVMLNELRSIDGKLLSGSWTGRRYSFDSEHFRAASQGAVARRDEITYTYTKTEKQSEANPVYHYTKAAAGLPAPLLVQEVYCTSWFLYMVFAFANRTSCQVEGKVR